MWESQVDRMLNEDLLVGPGRQARDTLRPLAYSTLADLVHHVKDRIDLDQVSRVIQVCFALVSSAGEHVWLRVIVLFVERFLFSLLDFVFFFGGA